MTVAVINTMQEPVVCSDGGVVDGRDQKVGQVSSSPAVGSQRQGHTTELDSSSRQKLAMTTSEQQIQQTSDHRQVVITAAFRHWGHFATYLESYFQIR